ncbi:aspartic peptidase domain-containing protein [Xylariaceae sp. FL1651]|nr:aspartic peptidase domain-containing protein [Xylariaceae sp. FL1651]
MALTSLNAIVAEPVPTVQMPLYAKYGSEHRVATDIVIPYNNQTIEVNYDLGSSDFWLFESDSTMNWGCLYLDCQGPCNVSVPEAYSYNPSKSATSTPVGPWHAQYGYGGGLGKLYLSDAIVNDTFAFTNPLGLSTTVPGVQVALAQYLQQRLGDPSNGSCTPVPYYSRSILGISPYIADPNPDVVNTTGPSFRQNLLEQGLVSAPVQSLWFEKAPEGAADTYYGVGLLGGIDTSKYTGPLVKIPKLVGEFDENEYYTAAANISFRGVPIPNVPADQSDVDPLCIIDSGSLMDGVNPADRDLFLNLTGLRENSARTTPGSALSWPGPCDSVPTDRALEYSFDGVNPGEHVVIKVPFRAYARGQMPEDDAVGWCTMAIYFQGCNLALPFSLASFFAADDAAGEIAVAQGGVAEIGSGVNEDSVVAKIPQSPIL